VSDGWAISMPLGGAVATAPLRHAADIEACVADDRLWLRGTRWDDALGRSLRKILGADRFHRLAHDQIARWGNALPSGELPAGPWTPLKHWLQPAAPATVLPAQVDQRAPLQFVRSAAEQSANMLLVEFQQWHEYATSAPQVRLKPLAFAVSDDGYALIHGEPLPPLAGARYAEADGIARPLGWDWSPAIDAAVLRTALSLGSRDVAVFAPDGSYDVVSADDFVRATRSAVRLTARELIGG
jgi:hypothetical protein